MSETPEKPDEGEPTFSGAKPGAWEAVSTPPPMTPMVLPPPGSQGQGYMPPQGHPPNAGATPSGQAGYRPVYDGGVTQPPPPNSPPPPFGGAPPYGQPGYPQNNYGQPNVAEMMAAAVLIPRWRRRRRRLILLPVLLLVIVLVVVAHGCASFVRMF